MNVFLFLIVENGGRLKIFSLSLKLFTIHLLGPPGLEFSLVRECPRRSFVVPKRRCEIKLLCVTSQKTRGFRCTISHICFYLVYVKVTSCVCTACCNFYVLKNASWTPWGLQVDNKLYCALRYYLVAVCATAKHYSHYCILSGQRVLNSICVNLSDY